MLFLRRFPSPACVNIYLVPGIENATNINSSTLVGVTWRVTCRVTRRVTCRVTCLVTFPGYLPGYSPGGLRFVIFFFHCFPPPRFLRAISPGF